MIISKLDISAKSMFILNVDDSYLHLNSLDLHAPWVSALVQYFLKDSMENKTESNENSLCIL